MNHHDEEILRLNKKIKQLIWRNEQNMSRSNQLEVENKRLSMKVDEMKQICTTTSSLNVKFRMQLEKESTEKENLHEANLKLKTKLNSLSVICNELNEKVKVLESNLKRKSVTRIQPQVQMINSIADIVVGTKDSEAFDDLQRRYDELDAEHHEAMDVIDQLEFELGDIDYLEMETQRLQSENMKLKEMLQAAGAESRQPTSVQDAGNNLSNLTLKVNDEEGDESLVNELKGIHTRKMMIQQKLEQFHHHRQSVSYGKSG